MSDHPTQGGGQSPEVVALVEAAGQVVQFYFAGAVFPHRNDIDRLAAALAALKAAPLLAATLTCATFTPTDGGLALALAPGQLGFDGLAYEGGALVGADEQVNAFGHALRQADQRRLHSKRWAPHSPSRIRYRNRAQDRQFPLSLKLTAIADIAYKYPVSVMETISPMGNGRFEPREKPCAFCATPFSYTNGSMRFCSKVCNFNFYVDRSDVDDCHPWTGGLYKDGYGAFFGIRAHRQAWTLAFGPILPPLQVLHACDNPACCNPNHLMLGTNKANMRDRDQKGRQQHGEKNCKAKLTESDVAAIQRRLQAGEFAREIAPDYGVHRSSIDRIARGEGWRVAAGDEAIPRKTRFKLDRDIAATIRAEFRPGPDSPTNGKALAKRYGVLPSSIYAVVKGLHYPDNGSTS